jgi:hypothetical protein
MSESKHLMAIKVAIAVTASEIRLFVMELSRLLRTLGCVHQDMTDSVEFLDAGEVDGDTAATSAGLADIDSGPHGHL